MLKLITIQCFGCGVIDIPRLSVSGQHIKAECRHCFKYKKFMPKLELPTLESIKSAIWEMENRSLEIINMRKKDIVFIESTDDKQYVEYWCLYLESIRNQEILSR